MSQETHNSMAPAGKAALSAAVCIGTYNQALYISECIESILAQSYPVQEIWVSDDASTDGTQAVMGEICRRYPTVHYYRQPRNLGIAENLSWVLAQPKTDLIARIDSDDRLETEFVATLAGLLARHPQAGYAHSEVNEIDSCGVQTRLRRLHRSAVYESPEESLRKNASGYRVAANCILYRAEALRQADYYHANAVWRSAEDWDLTLRLAILGWGNVYAAAPLARYRVWEDNEKERFKRRVPEIECVTNIYKERLIPEYQRRGWDTGVLKKNMRARAVQCAEGLDSPLFSKEERAIYKARLRELGDSAVLSLAIWMAESGFSPLARWSRSMSLRVKDAVKTLLCFIKSAGHSAAAPAPGAQS
jgi:hypothetical protein